MKARHLVVALGAVAAVAVPAAPAAAHPLGNFTVNHYDGLALSPSGVVDNAVVDTAEIPTLQQAGEVDTNGDGVASPEERAVFARARCAELAGAVRLTVNRTPLRPAVRASSFGYRPGAAGLTTSRLECRLEAATRIDARAGLTFEDLFESDRVGWHEITADASGGVRLDNSPVPRRSVSDELRRYPNDLLTSPLDVRRVSLQAVAGPGASTERIGAAVLPHAGLLTRALNQVGSAFNGLVGRRHVTTGVGLLAVALALVLGASHALLPGHGKTVMAAYIAGRRGSVSDAMVVGATVTATHTAGVLFLGLALSASASLAGESVLRWLGAASGLLIAGVGAGLLRSALRRRRAGIAPEPGHAHHGHDHPDDPTHVHPDGHPHARHAHGGHGHGRFGNSNGTDRDRLGRAGLVGMGLAGGLVPSPSALVVLLAAIGLGHTAFGIVLVLAYGLGMAATLTAAGLALVVLGGRVRRRATDRARAFAGRWAAAMPVATAALVIVVGLGLAGRSQVIV